MIKREEIHLKAPGDRGIGQSMVELLAGLFVLVPVLLFLLDIGVMTIANIQNGDLAKTAARVAASAADVTTAKSSITTFITNYNAAHSSGIITNLTLTYFNWIDPSVAGSNATGSLPAGYQDAQPGQTIAVTSITVTLPVPLPGLPASQVFTAYATLPIVGLKPNLPGNQGP